MFSFLSSKLTKPFTQSVRHGTSIRVLLLEDLEKIGNKGEIVTVKRGYARNYLVPKQKASYIAVGNLIQLAKEYPTANTLLRNKIARKPLILKDKI